MSIYFLFSVAASAYCFALATFVLFRHRNTQTIPFICLTYAISIWSSFPWATQTFNPTDQLTIARIAYMAASTVPTLFLAFVLTMLNRKPFGSRAVRAAAFLSAFFICCLGDIRFISGVRIEGGMSVPMPGIIYPAFVTFFGVICGYAFYLLLQTYKEANGVYRNKLKYVFLSFFIAYTSGLLHFIAAYTMREPLPHDLLIVLFASVLAYAIVRHHLLDIDLVARGAVTRAIMLVLVAVPLFVGRMLAESLVTLNWVGITRTVGTLGVSTLSYSLAIAFLRLHADRSAKRLSVFFLLLGIWNTGEILLVIPPHSFSVYLYRCVYAVGGLALVAWFRFWDEVLESHSTDSKGYAVLTWTACAIVAFCVSTPYVLKALEFDPTRRTAAHEIAGLGQPLYAVWYLCMLVAIAIWATRVLVRPPQRSRQLMTWLISSFILAGAAATSYFAYVPRLISIPIHAYLEIVLSIVMATGFVRFRSEKGEPIAMGIGVSAIAVPFIVGILFIHGAWGQILGGMLLVMSIPAVMQSIEKPIQAWVDTYLFTEFLYISESERMAKEEWNLSSLEDALPIVAKGVVSAAPYKSCTVSIIFEDRTKRPRFRTTQIRTSQDTIIEGSAWSEELDRAFLHYIRAKGRLVMRDEDTDLPPLVRDVEPMLFEAAVPLRSGGDIVGVIIVGAKQGNKSALHHKDLEILETLAQTVTERLSPSVEINLFRCVVSDSIHDAISNYLRPVLNKLELKIPLLDDDVRTLKKLRDLLKQLRTAAQTELAKGHRQEFDPVDMEALLREIHSSHELDAKAKRLRFDLDIVEPLPAIRKDRLWVDRCIGNLVTNAIKYTNSGTITLSAHAIEGLLIISVRDSGVGIPPESLKRVFEAGYRVPGKAREMAEGTGVGLANVQEFMIAMGGKVNVESEIGKGSRFSLLFPLVDDARSDQQVA